MFGNNVQVDNFTFLESYKTGFSDCIELDI